MSASALENPIVVREALPEDLEAFWRIAGTIYFDGVALPEDKQSDSNRRHFIAFLDGVPAGVFNLMELAAARGLATLRNGGIGMVAVLPEFRASGVGSAMLNFAVRTMREEGFTLSSLYGFAERYYRRFGYETCGGKLKFSVPVASMPRPKGGLAVRQVHCYDEVVPCYEAYARQRSGLSIRDAFWWERMAGDAMIYACGDPIEAYLLVKYKTGFHDQFELKELIWNSRRGYETMLSFMGDLAANRGTVVWHEGLDSPFFYRYLPRMSQIQASVGGPVMFRVVDVVGALSALVPASSGDFSLRIVDPVSPENEGPWRVSFSPGGVSVTATALADMTMDVQAFAQAFLGQPSLADLIHNGMVEVADYQRAQSAMALLTASQVALYDFF